MPRVGHVILPPRHSSRHHNNHNLHTPLRCDFSGTYRCCPCGEKLSPAPAGRCKDIATGGDTARMTRQPFYAPLRVCPPLWTGCVCVLLQCSGFVSHFVFFMRLAFQASFLHRCCFVRCRVGESNTIDIPRTRRASQPARLGRQLPNCTSARPRHLGVQSTSMQCGFNSHKPGARMTLRS